MACDRAPGEGEGRGWRPLTRGCHEVTGDSDGKALQGRTGASARFPAREPKQWRCRRSEAEPHAPPGLSPSGDWGLDHRIKRQFNP